MKPSKSFMWLFLVMSAFAQKSQAECQSSSQCLEPERDATNSFVQTHQLSEKIYLHDEEEEADAKKEEALLGGKDVVQTNGHETDSRDGAKEAKTECSADFGEDKACCGQPGDWWAAERKNIFPNGLRNCPRNQPICDDYKEYVKMGICRAKEASGQPAGNTEIREIYIPTENLEEKIKEIIRGMRDELPTGPEGPAGPRGPKGADGVCPVCPAPAPATPVCTNFATQATTSSGAWGGKCQELPADTKFVKMTMGSDVDYFKPVAGKTFCEMLRSNRLHLWSSDGINWVQPAYKDRHLGGSASGWPKDNGYGDRNYLPFWGNGDGKWCCPWYRDGTMAACS